MKLLPLAAIVAPLLFFSVAGTRLCGQVVIDNDLVVLLTEDFTGGLGTGAGQVRWTGSGGFAAVGGDRVVQIGGTSDEIYWGATHFIGNGQTLILGAPNADGTLIWAKSLNLGFGTRRIRVLEGMGNVNRADARFDATLSGRTLSIEGDGRLDMAVDNPSFVGLISLYGAELRLNASGSLSNIRLLDVLMGGAFIIDNAGTSNSTTGGTYLLDRFNDTASAIQILAGALRYIGQTSEGDSIEDLPRLSFNLGSNTIDIINNRADFFTEIRVKSLQAGQSATVNFISSSGVSDFGGGARLRVESALPLANGILPYATVNDADWASVAGNYIISYFEYDTGAQTNWNSLTINSSPTIDQVLSDNRSLNSLRLTGGRQVDLNNKLLRINAGALLSTGSASNTISGGLLRFSGNAYAHVYNTGGTGLTISSQIIGRNLTKTGPGSLTFSGTAANALNGGAYVNEGMLIFNKSAGVPAISSQAGWRLTIGDRGHSAIVRLDNHEQISNSADVWLRGGYADSARHVGLGHEGVLQFNGAGNAGLTETFRNLVVEGRGVIDFQGGTLGAPNFLILDNLSVRYNAEGGSVLFVRNWVEFEDRLLVKRSSVNLTASLPHIHFEGYAPGALLRDYNATYWEVVPFPEPSTCGAILSALGIGLWARRKLKSRNRYL